MDNSNDKKMKKILLFIVFTSYGFSQGEINSLSIDDAVEYGIENNRNLVNAEREIKMAYKESRVPEKLADFIGDGKIIGISVDVENAIGGKGIRDTKLSFACWNNGGFGRFGYVVK